MIVSCDLSALFIVQEDVRERVKRGMDPCKSQDGEAPDY